MKSEVYKAKWDRNFPLIWGSLFSMWVSGTPWVSARHVLASLASVWAALEVTMSCSVRSSQVFDSQLFVIIQWQEKAPPACPLSVQSQYIRTIGPVEEALSDSSACDCWGGSSLCICSQGFAYVKQKPNCRNKNHSRKKLVWSSEDWISLYMSVSFDENHCKFSGLFAKKEKRASRSDYTFVEFLSFLEL